jgi:RNA polymerase sigma-70 factor (ECF subfamily)
VKEDVSLEYLAERASGGDEVCFAELCGALKRKLFRAAKGVLGNEELALDAVSEAVCRAYKGIKRLREPRYAETWFTRILLNAAYDIRRKQKHEVAAAELTERVHYDDHNAVEMAELVESLPKELREIISLKYYAGYTLAETAAILGVPEGTVKSRLNRALNLLRLEFVYE